MFSRGSCPQRRNCSRRAPSQVVKLQSISSVPVSLTWHPVSQFLQLFDVGQVFGPPDFSFHIDQSWKRNKSHRDRFVKRLEKREPHAYMLPGCDKEAKSASYAIESKCCRIRRISAVMPVNNRKASAA